MSLPYSDPSNPALPSPLFSDVTAVRADHMRANNNAIFADLAFLDAGNPAAVALTGGSFKTAALANANTYHGRSLFTASTSVTDTPFSGAWRILGAWSAVDSSGRFTAMLDGSLETWEINYSGGAWGAWVKYADVYGNRTPAGTMSAFAGASAPDGFLLCDGSAISRATYAALFAAIGTVWGVGDGSTTFNIPNGRAVVLKGAGNQTINTRVKSGPALGAVEEDQAQGHYHAWSSGGDNHNATDTSQGMIGIGSRTITGNDYVRSPVTDGTNGTPRTGATTRDNSVGVNFIIKY